MAQLKQLTVDRELASLERASRKIAGEVKSLRASLERDLKTAAARRVKTVESFNRNR
ncbi:MAG TPA: hypothetical protein HA252_05235 [Candidatus Diapherotrites archaeon]|uniref:Uncharacterized protein n=1 Tax=Candidatus Iainarchaeum sp. TaxID=3101447 RepID=A0A7J4JHI8_9ARCH|nr:hypothetical protein [Candidatus Diapherotrites archaeon]HIH16784.1 hypothetical protein [Candidatus Diapherotrites archaeon]